MADISKITLPSNDEYNIKDATARQGLTGKQDTITANGILQGDGSGNITAAASSTADTLNNPNSDGTYVLQNTVSSGTSTLSWGEGGSSTDENVKQTASTPSSYTYWRPLLVGSSSNATEGFSPSTTTAGSYTFNTLEVQPSSGSIRMGTASMYNGSYTSKISPTTLTANRTITIPNASGTMALTSDIPDVSGKIDTAGTGLSKSGTTLNHSNSVTAQTTQALYPIKIDAQGHISEYGSAVTIPSVPSPADAAPLMDNATAAVGTSTNYAREDHVHPTDTSRQAKITASGILKGDGSGGVTAATGGTDYARMSDIPTVPSNIVNTITTTAGAHTAITSQKGNVSFNVPTTASHVGAIAAPSSPSSGNVLTYNGSSWVAQAPASGLPTQDATTNGKYLISNGTSGAAWNTITASSIGAQPSGSYKTTQTAVSDPTASGTSMSFIDTISQNTNGVVTATKKSIDTESVTEISIDGAPSSGSSNLVTSGGIYSALQAKQNSLPTITNNSGKYLTNNGVTLSWGTVDALPGQSGNAGKYLTTDGSSASWTAAEAVSVVAFDNTPIANSTNLLTSGAIYSALANAEDVFIAEYDSTTYANILAAYNAGKEIICYHDSTTKRYAQLFEVTSSGTFNFDWYTLTSGVTTKYRYAINSSGTWSLTTYTAYSINRTTNVNAADTNYTTLMARGEKLLDATTFDGVSSWSSQLVNGAIAWRYE